MEDGVWRTIRGRRVFIKKGQPLTQALRESGTFEKQDVEKQTDTQTTKKIEKEISEYKEKLKKYGIITKDDFPNKINKEFALEQLKAMDDIVKNDKILLKVFKENPLIINEDVLSLNDSFYSHYPNAFEKHSLNFSVFSLGKDSNETYNRIDELRKNGCWMSKELSNVSNQQYITYHEFGHIKEKVMVQNYIDNHPKFEEKYIKRMNNAKTQKDYDIHYHNMYKDALYKIETEHLLPIQEKNDTIKSSGGRERASAYGEYGLNELSKYGSRINSNEMFSEANVLLSKPTEKGKKTQLYKDIKELMEELYK